MSLLQSPYHLGYGGSPLVVLDQIYVGHVNLHRPVKIYVGQRCYLQLLRSLAMLMNINYEISFVPLLHLTP